LRRVPLRIGQSVVTHRCFVGRNGRGDRSIRRLRDPETLGEQTKHKRHLHRHTRRLDRNRPGLLSCNSLLKRPRIWTASAPIRASPSSSTASDCRSKTSELCLPRCSLLSRRSAAKEDGAGGTSDLFLFSNFYFLISSRRQFGDDFFEARIAPERVPEGEQF
jgi:hypothetical protein